MKSWLKHGWTGFCFGCACVFAVLRWTLWLVLCLLLAVEGWILSSHELTVPGFALRALEERLAAAQLRVNFGHAEFDPSGHILLGDVRLSLPAYREPIAVAQAAYLELDPWALLGGRIEPHRLHLTGTRFAVPAMLSHSGQAEDIMRDLDTTLRLTGKEIVIEHLTARIAGIAVTARGAIHQLPRLNNREATADRPVPLPEYLASHYPEFCRQVIRVTERLTALRQPELHLELTPSPQRGALAAVSVTAQGLKLDAPVGVEVGGIRLATRFPLQGETPVMAPLSLEVDVLDFANGTKLRGVHAQLRGILHPAQYTFDPRETQLTVDEASARGFALTQLAATVDAGPLPNLRAELIAAYDGLPLTLSGATDLSQQSGTVRIEGRLSPQILQPIGAALGRDLRRFIGFGQPLVLDLTARFAPGWHFERLTGWFRAWEIDAYHVLMDAGGGDIDFDGTHFVAHDAFATLGPNFARGVFEQDFSDLRFRFLLEGRLRPLAIGSWFGKWWPAFFNAFDFPSAPPDASVDVAGVWRQGHHTNVFVFADSTAPVVQGVKFDHMRTLLFIRPNFIDGLELFTTLGAGSARGTFTRQLEPGSFTLVGMDLDFESTLPLDVPSRVFGPIVADQLDHFHFAAPPKVKVRARFDGPAATDGPHQWLQLEAESAGDFGFYNFPLANLAFKGSIRDDEVKLDDVTVNFAGGVVTGKARAWGRDHERRLGFDLALRDGSLGRAVRVLEEFNAQARGVPPPPPGKFVQDKAGVKLNLAASAEGLYSDPYSFRGEGHATLDGAELGEVHMLGLLSELLSFTSLRFTAARANFRIEGPQLVFDQLDATGANSAIDAHGSYELRHRALDFKARVNPFRESKFLPSIVMGAVLSPFASVLEVKLTGTLDKPTWAFVNGPTNFLRNLTRPNSPATPEGKPDYLRR